VRGVLDCPLLRLPALGAGTAGRSPRSRLLVDLDLDRGAGVGVRSPPLAFCQAGDVVQHHLRHLCSVVINNFDRAENFDPRSVHEACCCVQWRGTATLPRARIATGFQSVIFRVLRFIGAVAENFYTHAFVLIIVVFSTARVNNTAIRWWSKVVTLTGLPNIRTT
jgi:hypothetical protein